MSSDAQSDQDGLFHRRQLLGLGLGAAMAVSFSRPALAAAIPPSALAHSRWPQLLREAQAAFDQFGDRIKHRDRFVVADFNLPSSVPRLMLVDRETGLQQRLLVAHGRGSDPDHSGWLQRFSNVDGSNATSRGAYMTGALYTGQHGRSQRLVGLEPTNDNALNRAIVIHGAWYSNADMIAKHGKLGRSEGCFAVGEDQIQPLLEWLGPDRLLYANKLMS